MIMTKGKKSKSYKRRKKVEKKPKSMSLAEKAIIIALVAVVLIGASYIALNMLRSPSSGETSAQTPTETPPVEETPEPTPQSTDENVVLRDMGEAPGFTLKSINGETVRLADFHGKVVLLDFWATWCSPCRMSISQLKRLNNEFSGEGFVIVSVNLGEKLGRVKSFASTEGMTWTILLDSQGQVADSYGVRGIPTFILIDKHGRIRLKITGLTPNFYETLSSAISQLLAQP